MRTLRAVSIVFVLSGGAVAQTDPRTEFEVASVKPAAPGARGTLIRPGPGGGLTITNMTLKEMIVFSYRIQPFQISGGPGWLDSAHYDIVAKPEAKPNQGEVQVMLQALLADRFQLTIHRESKELLMYALVLARKDSKLGPSLIESKDGSCTPPDLSRRPPPPEPGNLPALACGNMMWGRGRMRAVSVSIGDITPTLSRLLGRVVNDKTGLIGKFDISVEWTPDESPAFPLSPNEPKPPADPAGPSIFAALQEQLGLKLEPQKGPVEIFVIDRAEKPSEN